MTYRDDDDLQITVIAKPSIPMGLGNGFEEPKKKQTLGARLSQMESSASKRHNEVISIQRQTKDAVERSAEAAEKSADAAKRSAKTAKDSVDMTAKSGKYVIAATVAAVVSAGATIGPPILNWIQNRF